MLKAVTCKPVTKHLFRAGNAHGLWIACRVKHGRGKVSERNYHHGDLQNSLIEAGLVLLQSRKVESFSLADAARHAGVSSAAPYRHFTDRQDYLAQLAGAGFRLLQDSMEEALKPCAPGSIDSMAAIGCAYVNFGAGNPELFHLMWGAHRHFEKAAPFGNSNETCYGLYVETLRQIMEARGLDTCQVESFGAPLWAMVHGFAALIVAGNERFPSEMPVVQALIERTTKAYFEGMAEP